MASLIKSEEALEKLISSLVGNKNMSESQTRFHIIDKVLTECLGWDREAIEVEKYENNNGFTDYELGKPRIAILEAKREGKVFEIPAGLSKKLTIDLNSLRRISDETLEAIEQAQRYCSTRGVPVAIITNGHQYIAFLSSRQDGISIFDGNAVVFNSLAHLKENFTLAWQLISYHGIKERHITRYLVSGETGIPNKLSSRLSQYPHTRYPSDIQVTLRQLSELFLQDIMGEDTVEEKFFAECYCDSGALSKYALLSKNILEARYASLFSNNEPFPKITPVKDKKQDNFLPEIMSEAISRRPIVLLGDVGVGKTSFIKNLMYNSAHEEFKNAIYIYIDLGSKAALATNLKAFILDEIELQLFEKYKIDTNNYQYIKGVYASEISRFSNGIWGNKKEEDPALYKTKLSEHLEKLIQVKDQHLKRCINSYSKSSQRQVIISLDNADQRDFEIQQDAFIIAQELAQEWNSTVFISVRPQTFFKSKRSGALSAYPHKIFTISPPRIDIVVKKRLNFALSIAQGLTPIATLSNTKLNATSLTSFIKVLNLSLAENPDINEFLTNITGGNIRAAIEFVTSFIGSPNVDAEKIIKIMDETGRYTIPLHEFTKSALLGDYSHYNPNTSLAMNVFDVSAADEKEHFLVPILIAYLHDEGEHKDNDGFCVTNVLFEELQNHGFTPDQISAALRRCTNKKLVETSQRITFEEDINGTLMGEMPSAFRVTTIGVYHITRWMSVFTYLDSMVFDTPIFDVITREDLLRNINSIDIKSRYNRVLNFQSYLKKCWHNIPRKPSYFNFTESINDNINTFNSVKRAVESHQPS